MANTEIIGTSCPRGACRPRPTYTETSVSVRVSPAVTRAQPQLSLATRGDDWASQGKPKGNAEIPVVTRESRRNSRKTTASAFSKTSLNIWKLTVHASKVMLKFSKLGFNSTHPWDSPGKNTGVGCHFLLQCMKVERESEVAQLRPTLSDPMDYSLPGPSVHGIFQARVLEWGASALLVPSKTCSTEDVLS